MRRSLIGSLPQAVYVTGTDTDVGKTITCAVLCAVLGRAYWKPVQAGLDGETDTQVVARLSGATVWPERHRLRRAASPHAAARDAQVRLSAADFTLPTSSPLIVEGAGGWMVPYGTDPLLWQADVVRTLGLPVVVVARTGLGTLNHTLSTLRAIRADGLTVAGLLLVGPPHPENEADLATLGSTVVLARLPRVTDPSEEFAALCEAIRTDG